MNIDRFANILSSMFLLLAGAVAFLLITAPAQAAPAAPPAAQAPVVGVFAALDSNKDQALSLQEFQAGYAGLQRAIALEIRLREQFRSVDADHNGAIDGGEYARLALVKRAGKTAPALSAFDTNHDQKLAFGEYLAVVRRLAAPQAPTLEKKQ